MKISLYHSLQNGCFPYTVAKEPKLHEKQEGNPWEKMSGSLVEMLFGVFHPPSIEHLHLDSGIVTEDSLLGDTLAPTTLVLQP